jgi:UDP-GlcNAc:undecaprenyl-phosphate/decaprenyl-phosphate GlcNAc-1-phosphate transferase
VIPDPRVFGIAFAVALGATWAVAAVARRKGLLDLPEERRTHRVPTPRLGGVGILLGIAAGWIAMHALPPWAEGNWDSYRAPLTGEYEGPIAAGAAAFFLVGLLDDLRRGRRGIPAWAKLLLQVAAGTVPVVLGMTWYGSTRVDRTHAFDGWPGVHLGAAAPVLSVLWFVAVVNVVNFMDGIDSIASAIVLPIFVFATVWGWEFTYHVPWCAAGATAAFLVWNRPPARVFMGDGGSHLLGFLVAVSVFHPRQPPSWFEWIFQAAPWPLIAAPLVPSIVDVGEALIHKARHGIPMSLAHNDHLYQRLVKAGVPTGLVALRYGLLSVAAILCAGPLAHAIGVLPASAVGGAVLALHLATGARRVRGVPRLAKP